MWEISFPTPIITTVKHEYFTTFRPKLWTKEHHNLHSEKRIYIVASFLKEIKRQWDSLVDLPVHNQLSSPRRWECTRWVNPVQREQCVTLIWQDCTSEITTINLEIVTILNLIFKYELKSTTIWTWANKVSRLHPVGYMLYPKYVSKWVIASPFFHPLCQSSSINHP